MNWPKTAIKLDFLCIPYANIQYLSFIILFFNLFIFPYSMDKKTIFKTILSPIRNSCVTPLYDLSYYRCAVACLERVVKKIRLNDSNDLILNTGEYLPQYIVHVHITHYPFVSVFILLCEHYVLCSLCDDFNRTLSL